MADSEPAQYSPGYSIRVASRLTGLSADTLRMWERRYGFPRPERNASRVRVYSKDDVERLSLIARALKNGYRAGEVVPCDTPALRQMLSEVVVEESPERAPDGLVAALLDCIRHDNADGLRAELRQAVATHGAKRFITDVASPLVQAVGTDWAQGRLAIHHEHLLTETLTTQLRLLLSAYEVSSRRPFVLLATLPGELHSLGLEMAALFVALSNATPRLLGVDTPVDQIEEAARALHVNVVALSISSGADPETANAQVSLLLQRLPTRVQIWVGGQGSSSLRIDSQRLVRTRTWSQLESAVAAWSE
ncbi:MAG: MerR family transcriptional regulator [Polyangiaceae bacterium]